ncbi:MAG: Rrf2 family transcriptional regulator [Bacillota bacterium]|jgi:Rrf2 family cysteine metabolism transcriptional repressor
MRISTRAEYGLRAMLDLAEHYRQAPITLRSIAARQGISESYLEQLIAVLKKAGLVESVRGAQGGYVLACDPGRIKISVIFTCLEGPIAPVDCVRDHQPAGECRNSQKCAVQLLWLKLSQSMEAVLETTTLADLVAQSRELNQANFIYQI